MTASLEQRINRVRELLIEVSLDISEHQTNSYGGEPELDATVNKIDDILIQFEQVVNAIPNRDDYIRYPESCD